MAVGEQIWYIYMAAKTSKLLEIFIVPWLTCLDFQQDQMQPYGIILKIIPRMDNCYNIIENGWEGWSPFKTFQTVTKKAQAFA